jgi:hypothetical protein
MQNSCWFNASTTKQYGWQWRSIGTSAADNPVNWAQRTIWKTEGLALRNYPGRGELVNGNASITNDMQSLKIAILGVCKECTSVKKTWRLRQHDLQIITLTSYFYKHIYQKLKYVYFYKSIFQDKSTHIVFIFPNSTT